MRGEAPVVRELAAAARVRRRRRASRSCCRCRRRAGRRRSRALLRQQRDVAGEDASLASAPVREAERTVGVDAEHHALAARRRRARAPGPPRRVMRNSASKRGRSAGEARASAWRSSTRSRVPKRRCAKRDAIDGRAARGREARGAARGTRPGSVARIDVQVHADAEHGEGWPRAAAARARPGCPRSSCRSMRTSFGHLSSTRVGRRRATRATHSATATPAARTRVGAQPARAASGAAGSTCRDCARRREEAAPEPPAAGALRLGDHGRPVRAAPRARALRPRAWSSRSLRARRAREPSQRRIEAGPRSPRAVSGARGLRPRRHPASGAHFEGHVGGGRRVGERADRDALHARLCDLAHVRERDAAARLEHAPRRGSARPGGAAPRALRLSRSSKRAPGLDAPRRPAPRDSTSTWITRWRAPRRARPSRPRRRRPRRRCGCP